MNTEKITISKMKIKRNVLYLRINIVSISKQIRRLLLVSRKKDCTFIEGNLIKKTSKYIYFSLPLEESILKYIYYDFYMEILDGLGCAKLIKVEKKSSVQIYIVNIFFKKQSYIFFNPMPNQYIISLYFSKGGSLSLQIRERDKYDSLAYEIKKIIACLLYPFMHWFYKDSKLTYEKFSNYARDNSYYYFCYCKEINVNDKLYFIINKDSPDFYKLKKYKNYVVKFMSVKHFLLIFSAKYLVASEAKGHAYGWRHNQGLVRYVLNRKTFIFLQHGVLGLKKVDNTFFANNRFNKATLFVASSELERCIIRDELGYSEKEIITTGLCRWDSKKDLKKENKIFIMPTWRVELENMGQEDFLETEFYKEYSKLLCSEKLKIILERYGYFLHFMVHPKLLKFENYFPSNEYIYLRTHNESTIEDELKTSKLIITDYSSIMWDSFVYGIPVFLFQFDQKSYLRNQGSYFDFETNFSDIIITNHELLVEKIHNLLSRNDLGAQQKNLDNYRSKFFLYNDKKNCFRVNSAIKKWEDSFEFPCLIKKGIKKLKVLWR
ncbi:CDP-glycerol glycerophosphotransferase family protein [Lactococcus formosensis]|uniref:CDP-glycerol glycerophosphotransferase family protein n=1 Tax=Lactococcus formosensis TaxID=1281486 RepID=UPI0022E007E1|nr:CDP-glycerol glycerophosphotransferase family protein [Lactococcus formosensis]